MENRKDDQSSEYQTLDKDYGRAKFTGSGYGELNQDEYDQLEALLQ